MTGVKVEEAELSPADKERQDLLSNKPPLSECLSLHDFETVASKVGTFILLLKTVTCVNRRSLTYVCGCSRP